jgi:hypothetical protein
MNGQVSGGAEMNRLNFTAEASLSRNERFYSSLENYAHAYRAKGMIEPAYLNVRQCIKGCGGDDLCIECCICLAHGGKAQYCCM